MIKGKVVVEGLDTMDYLNLGPYIIEATKRVISELPIIDKEDIKEIPIGTFVQKSDEGETIVDFLIDTELFDKNISGDKDEFTIELLKSVFGGKFMYSIIENHVEREDEVSFCVAYNTLYTDKTDLYEFSSGLMEYEYITTRSGHLLSRLNQESSTGCIQKHARNFKDTVEYLELNIEYYKNNLEDLLYGIIDEELSVPCKVRRESINDGLISFNVELDFNKESK